jgi:hypothetical protein
MAGRAERTGAGVRIDHTLPTVSGSGPAGSDPGDDVRRGLVFRGPMAPSTDEHARRFPAAMALLGRPVAARGGRRVHREVPDAQRILRNSTRSLLSSLVSFSVVPAFCTYSHMASTVCSRVW